jgi:hypothetical protein
MLHNDTSVPLNEVCDVSDLAFFSDVNDSDVEQDEEQRPYFPPPVTPHLLASILKQVRTPKLKLHNIYVNELKLSTAGRILLFRCQLAN